MVPAPEESMVVLPPMSPTKLSWKATIGARFCAGWSLNEMVLLPVVDHHKGRTGDVVGRVVQQGHDDLESGGQRIAWQVCQKLLDQDQNILFAMPVVHHAGQAG